MRRKKEFELEEYDDYDFDYENLNNTSYDYSDYETFNQIDNNYEDDSIDEEVVGEETHTKKADSYESNNFISILSIVSTWFIRIGIAIAIILIAFFVVKGQISNLLLYIVCLIASFFFGYFFMFILVKYGNND